jgi:hypothetical protein
MFYAEQWQLCVSSRGCISELGFIQTRSDEHLNQYPKSGFSGYNRQISAMFYTLEQW